MSMEIISLAIAIPFILLIGLVMALKKLDSVEADNSELRSQHTEDRLRISKLEDQLDSVELMSARGLWPSKYKPRKETK